MIIDNIIKKYIDENIKKNVFSVISTGIKYNDEFNRRELIIVNENSINNK